MHLLRHALSRPTDPAGVTGRAVILGVGSPFGDDRIGWEAADAVRAAAWYPARQPGLRAVALDRPGLGLLDEMAEVDQAIVIDAMRTGGRPGTIRRLVPGELGAGVRTFSGHDAGVAEALCLGRVLGLLPPRIAVFGIEASSAHDGEPAVALRAALPRLVSMLLRELG
jgi:hydrogenase maturation protease